MLYAHFRFSVVSVQSRRCAGCCALLWSSEIQGTACRFL